MKMVFSKHLEHVVYPYIVSRESDIPKCIHSFIKDAENLCVSMGGRYADKKGNDALNILHWGYEVSDLDNYRKTHHYDEFEWNEFVNDKNSYFDFD